MKIDAVLKFISNSLKKIVVPINKILRPRYAVKEQHSDSPLQSTTGGSNYTPKSNAMPHPTKSNISHISIFTKIFVGASILLIIGIEIYSSSTPEDQEIKFIKVGERITRDPYYQLGLFKGQSANLKILLNDLEENVKKSQQQGRAPNQLDLRRLKFLRERMQQGDF